MCDVFMWQSTKLFQDIQSIQRLLLTTLDLAHEGKYFL